MLILKKLKQGVSNQLEKLRLRVSHPDALPQLAILGLASGIITGLVIVGFRYLIETAQLQFLPNSDPESYEQLSVSMRFLLPVLGGLTIGIIFQLASRSDNLQVGIVHVMERMAYHQGTFPMRNFILQFLGGTLSIISGHSVGREGPSVHLGAASSSFLGQFIGLPRNTLRVLVGCGTAAAIAASFNTPLAGVILAMEVIILEYSLVSFIPIILAAVSATTIMQIFFEAKLAFTVPAMHLESNTELPFIALCGIIIGMLAALFIQLVQFFSRFAVNKPAILRLLAAGILTGLLAIYVPQIMGIGYDTVNNSLTGSAANGSLLILFFILIAKILATTFGIGMGLPAGLIGPTLFIGAIAGSLLGTLGHYWYNLASPVGYYSLLGMGAMMGAVLQAPLAALTAMLELTANSTIILPGMLIIVFASLTSRVIFAKKSVFLMIMQSSGLDYRNDPISQSLRRTGVAGAMNRDIVSLESNVTLDKIQVCLDSKPHWIIIIDKGEATQMMPSSDLAHQFEQIKLQLEANTKKDKSSTTLPMIDLLEIPAKRLELAPIELQANLQQAIEKLEQSGAQALYVHRAYEKNSPHIYGVLTLNLIEASYRQ